MRKHQWSCILDHSIVTIGLKGNKCFRRLFLNGIRKKNHINGCVRNINKCYFTKYIINQFGSTQDDHTISIPETNDKVTNNYKHKHCC